MSSEVSPENKRKEDASMARESAISGGMNSFINEISVLFGRMAIPVIIYLIVGFVAWFIYLVVPALYDKPLGLAVATFFSSSFALFVAYTVLQVYRLKRKKSQR